LEISRRFPLKSVLLAASILAMVSLSVALFAKYAPSAWDWFHFFRPAAQALLRGENPYGVDGFYNPPWVMALFAPILLLPDRLVNVVFVLFQLVTFSLIGYRLSEGKPLAVLLTLLSPFTVWGFMSGNIDWLVLLGLLCPPQLGLFLVLIKPQMGAGIALYWAIEAWKRGGWSETVRVFFPVSIAFALSFLIFGFYPTHYSGAVFINQWNASLFPYALPLGLGLIVYAILRSKPFYAAAAGVFLSPYVGISSYAITILPGFPTLRRLAVVVALQWLAVLCYIALR
jgi:hypothetical protein